MFRRLGYSVALMVMGIVLSGCTHTSTADNANNNAKIISERLTKPNVKAADYNVQLGVGYLREGQMERSKSKLLLALKQGPTYSPAYDAMALYLDTTGQPDQAEKYHQKSIAIDPKAGNAQNNYGTFLCKHHRYQESIRRFLLAAADPNYLSPANAYENAGYCAMMIPNKQQAKYFFNRAIQQDPRRAGALLELGQLAYDAGQYPEALDYVQRLQQNVPSLGAEALWLKIRTEKKLGKLDAVYSDELKLKNEFPKSAEKEMLLASQNNHS